MTWIRVEDKSTGHRYDIDERSFDESAHKKVDLKAYPDLDGPGARPRPAQYRTTKAAAPASADTKAGQPAAPKENSR